MVTTKELSFEEMENLTGGIADPDAYGVTCWRLDGGTDFYPVTDGAFRLITFNNALSIKNFEDTYAACELGSN